MKKLLSILTLCMGLCCVSCYDDSALVERIDALEQSTIASLKASISSLESQSGDIKSSIASLEQSGNANATEIAALKTSLGAIEAKIEELKSWVEKLLEGYYTKEEIDAQIQSLNTEIETLRTKISSIESKLDILMREFVISFDDTEIGILAGGTTSVGYTITGATDKTTVKALGQNGWSAKVTPEGTDKGKITVTAPTPLTEDEIIVLVYDGEYRTIMSSINFVTGIVTPSQTAVELEAEAGTIDITVTSNLNYKVSIPEDAKEWLSVVDTKVTKTETMTFAFTANEFSIRRAEVSFVDDADNIITKVSIIQQGSATEVTLTEAGTLLNSLGSNTYQSIKSLKINGPINGSDVVIINRMTKLENLDLSNASITEGGEPYIGNEYSSNDCIGYCMFQNATFKNIILPNTITTIEPHAFAWSETLESVVIGDKVTIIDEYAFHMCKQLSKVTLNDVLEIIGYSAFYSCENITTISIPKTVKKIDDSAFRDCKSLKELILPSELTYIGSLAFQWNSFSKITIPAKVEYIGKAAFYDCENLDEIHVLALPSTLKSMLKIVSDYTKPTLYIPKGTYNEYFYTELGKFSRIIEE